jgi:hypothetical protein
VNHLKGIGILFVLAFAVNFATEKWVIKDPADPEDTGFVVQTPGPWGMDEVAKALAMALGIFYGGKLVRSLLGGKKGS